MLRKLSILPILLLLIVLAIPPVFVKGSIITVCPTGCSFTTIKDAFNAANTGDTINIKSTYNSIKAGESFGVALIVPDSVTITGDTNANGQPTTTIDLAPGEGSSICLNRHDGFVITSYNDVVENLNFIDSSGASNICRVIAQGPPVPPHSGAGTAVRGTGLEISNVNIDMRGPAGDHAQNDVWALGNSDTIQNSVLQGAYDTTITIDGDTWTITNNVINGLDESNNIVTTNGITYGDDVLYPTPIACSGFPTGYSITGNTFTGFTNAAIIACNSKAPLTVSGNTIIDAEQDAIDLSTSQGITISDNAISWSRVPAHFGIAMPADNNNPTVSATISGNTVTGRFGGDPGSGSQGLVLGNCLSCQIIGNTVQYMDSYGIDMTSTTGTTVSAAFDSNVVSNNNGNGIYYVGSDGSGTQVDSSVMKNNVANYNKGSGMVFEAVQGAGNVFENNTASGNAGFGFTLATLRGTQIANDFGSCSVNNVVNAISFNNQCFPNNAVFFFTNPSNQGSITACSTTFTNGQGSGSCPSSFSATANTPSGWRFDNWATAGTLSCPSQTSNPTSCSGVGGLTAVFATQATISSPYISWGSCSNPPESDGAILSVAAGTTIACYVPVGYSVQSWSCTGGLTCSGSGDITVVTVSGPGTISLTLKLGSLSNPESTDLTASSSSNTVSGTLTANGNGLNPEPIVLIFNNAVYSTDTGPGGAYSYDVGASGIRVQVFFLGDYSGTTQYLPSAADTTT